MGKEKSEILDMAQDMAQDLAEVGAMDRPTFEEFKKKALADPEVKREYERQAFVIALDLEGTLITGEESRIPRPGLYNFLEACRELGRVVQYTMVDEETVREIARELVAAGHAPEWYADIEWIDWFSVDTDYKDLNLIPGAGVKNAVLVDDHMGFVAPGQEHRWIQIPFFDGSDSDENELDLALRRINNMRKKETRKSHI